MTSTELFFSEALAGTCCFVMVCVGGPGLSFWDESPRIFKLSVAWMIFWAIPVAWILLRWYFRLIHFLAVN